MKKVLIGIAAVIVLFFILFLVIACKEYMEGIVQISLDRYERFATNGISISV